MSNKFTIEELKAAVDTGHKASSVLRVVLEELVENHSCPVADGFEGRDTYPACGECLYCVAKNLIDEG